MNPEKLELGRINDVQSSYYIRVPGDYEVQFETDREILLDGYPDQKAYITGPMHAPEIEVEHICIKLK